VSSTTFFSAHKVLADPGLAAITRYLEQGRPHSILDPDELMSAWVEAVSRESSACPKHAPMFRERVVGIACEMHVRKLDVSMSIAHGIDGAMRYEQRVKHQAKAAASERRKLQSLTRKLISERQAAAAEIRARRQAAKLSRRQAAAPRVAPSGGPVSAPPRLVDISMFLSS
jgi:C4-dicarboxylate-specific signal transduction histidine kinase